jgi:nitrate/nitrite-specific signal transduction histidine kinase
MRERMERLNGQLSIESRPGGGTTVRAQAFKRDYDTELDGTGGPEPVSAA